MNLSLHTAWLDGAILLFLVAGLSFLITPDP